MIAHNEKLFAFQIRFYFLAIFTVCIFFLQIFFSGGSNIKIYGIIENHKIYMKEQKNMNEENAEEKKTEKEKN